MTADRGRPSIDGFEELVRIGAGGFSSVYRAHQPAMGRDVAIKVLHADFSSESDRRTFERECRALGVLSRHPNIVTVYSAAITNEGRPCIVMELYAGTARERLEAGPVPARDVLRMGIKVAGALETAHRSGVLHRDLKPHNLFVSTYGEPALGDFGISTIDDERTVTGSGGLSIAYAAPEILEDEAASPSSDIYALAASLYHLVDGSPPFKAPQLRATVRRILHEPAQPPSSANVPAPLGDVLVGALAKRPGDRPASAADFADALRKVERRLGYDPTDYVVPDSARGRGAPIPAERDRVDAHEHTVARDGRQPTDDAIVRSGVAGSVPVAPAARPAEGADAVDGDSSSTLATSAAAEHTVRRDSKAAVSAPVEPSSSEPSPLRRWAAVALALCVIAAIVGLLVFGRDREGDTTTSATSAVIDAEPDDPGAFFEVLGVPADVEVDVSPGGDVVVSFDPVEGAVGYEVVSQAPSVEVGEVRSVDSDESVGRFDVDTGLTADQAACWVVRAVGEQRRGAESDLVCVGL